jgi:hypothetical protein
MKIILIRNNKEKLKIKEKLRKTFFEAFDPSHQACVLVLEDLGEYL